MHPLMAEAERQFRRALDTYPDGRHPPLDGVSIHRNEHRDAVMFTATLADDRVLRRAAIA